MRATGTERAGGTGVRVALAALAFAALTLAGCSAPAPVPATTDRTPARRGPGDASDRAPTATAAGAAAAGSVEALAAQAARDIEVLRAIRAEGAREPADLAASGAGAGVASGAAPGSGATAAAPSSGRGAPAANGPPAIIWNTPDRPGAAAAPLARDEPPPIEVAPVPAPDPDAPLSPEEREALSELGLQLVQLRQRLYRESIGSEQPVRELLAIAAMSLIDPELDLPSGIERDLSREEVELLERLHEFFVGLGRRLDSSTRAEEAIVEAVLELEEAIVRKPQLELPTIALCRRIGGFGDYDAFERTAFLAHEERPVILYLEIEGFSSVRNKREQWVTEISQQLEIYSDRDGIPVWNEPWQKAVDVTGKKRRDFFTTQLVTLPEALSVGRYHLKIRVRDEHSGAEAEASLPFEMVADAKLAAEVP